MSHTIVTFLNVLVSFILALLITAQTNEYGEQLINNYKGLALVVFVLLASGLWNIISLIAGKAISA